MTKPELYQTDDGSDTLFNPDLKEHYHSTFGAIQESKHVFIENGLLALDQDAEPVEVFEVGFGTGLNALLTFLTAKKRRREVHYATVEKYPLERAVWKQLNYPERLQDNKASELFNKIHETAWGSPQPIDESFTLTKHREDLCDFTPAENSFHLVYFDAFAPDVQPELWTEEIFRNIYNVMQTGGILMTYSCKGEVKRNLKKAGFLIEQLPGPPGKREILRARKS